MCDIFGCLGEKKKNLSGFLLKNFNRLLGQLTPRLARKRKIHTNIVQKKFWWFITHLDGIGKRF